MRTEMSSLAWRRMEPGDVRSRDPGRISLVSASFRVSISFFHLLLCLPVHVCLAEDPCPPTCQWSSHRRDQLPLSPDST